MVFNRQVDDIRVTQYIDPGVEDNSVAKGLAAVGEGALRVDQQIGEGALRNELTAMRDLYETNSFALAKEGEDPTITPADKEEIGAESRRIGAMQRAVQQGTLSNDMFRLKAEGALRAAIARRPGLAAEYRQLASNTLGMDVSGAAIEFLAQQEAEIVRASAAKVASENKSALEDDEALGKRIRATLKTTTSTGADYDMLSDTALAEKARTDVLFKDVYLTALNIERSNEEAKIAASITTNTAEATKFSQQDEMTKRVADAGASFSSLAMRARDLSVDGLTPEETEEFQTLLINGRTRMIAMRQELLSLSGRVSPEYMANATKQLEEMEAAIGAVLTDTTSTTGKAVELFVSLAELKANQDPAFASLNVISKALGSEAAAKVLGELDAPQKEALAQSIQDSTTSTVPPEVRLGTAVAFISGMTARIAGLKPEEKPESMRQLDADMLKRRIGSVVDVPENKFIVSQWAGPQGAQVRLSGEQGKQIYNHIPEAERQAVGAMLLDSNRRSLDAIRTLWEKEGRGEATFELKADGTFIQPKDPAQALAARQFEAPKLAGTAMIGATTIFTGMDVPSALSYLNRARPVTTATQANATNVPRNPAPTTTNPAQMSADAEWFNAPLPTLTGN